MNGSLEDSISILREEGVCYVFSSGSQQKDERRKGS